MYLRLGACLKIKKSSSINRKAETGQSLQQSVRWHQMQCLENCGVKILLNAQVVTCFLMSLMYYNVQFNTKILSCTKKITDIEKDQFFAYVYFPVIDS